MLALLMFYETRKKPKKVFKVLSCVIYTNIKNYICIEYLGYEKMFLSYLRIGSGWSFKHVIQVITTYW